MQFEQIPYLWRQAFVSLEGEDTKEMRFKMKGRRAEEAETEEMFQTSNGSASEPDMMTRQARFRIYSCAFCEFVRENTTEIEPGVKEDQGSAGGLPDAFESKYLYHMASVHGLRR